LRRSRAHRAEQQREREERKQPNAGKEIPHYDHLAKPMTLLAKTGMATDYGDFANDSSTRNMGIAPAPAAVS
jgi:hypothetical protein